jgi:DNA (cytosine-5)-methyltransferase 1
VDSVKIGSLCTGIMGNEMAMGLMGIEVELAWYSEIDKNCSTLIAEHHPDVPNLGDLKLIDWSTVEKVDVLTAGYPCQPFSTAGKRGGVTDERHLWPWIKEGIRALRPPICLFENVAAHRTLGFDIVLKDLAEIGFDAEWSTLRASDIGACHRRDRLFIVATDADHRAGDGERSREELRKGSSIATDSHQSQSRTFIPQQDGGGNLVEAISSLLPASAAGNFNDGESVESWEARRQRNVLKGINGNGQGTPLTMAVKLLPTPTASDSRGGRNDTAVRTDPQSNHHSGTTLSDVAYTNLWGKYAPAIARWAEKIKRVAPPPVDEDGRLSPLLVEWMMGFPDGWVTGQKFSRSQQLKMLGNSVVPQQVATAWSMLWNRVGHDV